MGTMVFLNLYFLALAELEGDQREPWPPLRVETTIDKVPKLLLKGAQITETS